MDQTEQKDLKEKMRPIFNEFVAIEAVNDDEKQARAACEEKIRSLPRSWEYLCGMAEGVKMLTDAHPFAHADMTFRLIARVTIISIAKVALEAIQEAEDQEGFPKELDNG
jgi:hypothetical protein